MNIRISENRKKRELVTGSDAPAYVERLTDTVMLRNTVLADRMLEELGHARSIKPTDMPKDIVSIGSTVTYRDEAAGKIQTVTLVYPEHANPMDQRVSIMTPVGVALLGLSVGAAFYCDTGCDQRRLLTVMGVLRPSANESGDPS